MINSFKQKDGRVGVILWGALTKEPQMKTTKNGDIMCWFFVRYGFEPQGCRRDVSGTGSME